MFYTIVEQVNNTFVIFLPVKNTSGGGYITGKSLNCEVYRDCLEKNFLKTILKLKDGRLPGKKLS